MVQRVLLDEQNRTVPLGVYCHASNNTQMAAIIRYVGCYYKCPFCFAAGFSHNTEVMERYAASGRIAAVAPMDLAKAVINAIQGQAKPCLLLTGGATLLDLGRTNEIIELLSILNEKMPDCTLRVILQTSGATLCKSDIREVVAQIGKFKNLRILMEQSIKGTNPQEFASLSGSSPEGYKAQILGYQVLSELAAEFEHVTHRARLGIGPHPTSIIFTYPHQSTRAMFTKTNWSDDFKKIYEDQNLRYGYMGMEIITVLEGGINTVRLINLPAIEALAKAGIVADRTRDELYKFPIVATSPLNIPDAHSLTQEELYDLDRQHAEIYQLFTPIHAGESYLSRHEFGQTSQ